MNPTLLSNSLIVACASMFVACTCGLFAAICVAAAPRKIRRMLLAAGVVAIALPPFLIANTWLDLLGDRGWLHGWIPLKAFSLPSAVLLLSLLLWPIPFLLATASLRKLSPALLESDPLLRGFRFTLHLLCPAVRLPMAIGALVVFVLALNNFTIPSLLQVKVLPAEIWIAFNTSLDARTAFAASWPMLAASVLLLLPVWYMREVSWPHRAPLANISFRRQLGRPTLFLASAITVAIVGLSVIAPFVQIAFSTRTWTEFVPATLAGASAIGNSAAYAGIAAALVIAGGLLLMKVPGSSVAWLLFLIPGIFIGIALASGLNRPELNWFYRSALIVIFALVLRYLCFGWSLSRAALRAVDQRLIEMLQLEGARQSDMFRWAQWPQIGPAVLASGYLVYLLCLWDVETLILIVPPGGETLALRIFNLLHYGHNAHVNALCVVLVMLSIAPILLWQLWIRRPTFPPAPEAAVLILATLCAGCSPQDSAGSSELRSSIFSRAEVIGHRGTGPGEFHKPRSVAVDGEDNLFVADFTGRIQKFSPDGRFLAMWHMPEVERGKPKGMDRDRSGNIVIVEPHYARVNHFDSSGRLVRQWGHSGTNEGQLSLPRAIAVDSRSNLIVTEYWALERVQKFAADGQKLIRSWGRAGNGPGEFNRPEGVAVDSADRIYVADSCNHRIQVFTPDGNFLKAYGQPGAANGQLSYPYDVRLDSEGRQYVCEFGNSRIQVFDRGGRSIEVIGKAGVAPGQFANPWSIALDSKGNLYIADSQNHRVQKLVRASKS